MSSTSQEQRIAIITGGTKGMGRTICESFQDKGYTVFAFDIGPLMPMRDGIHSVEVDITNQESITNGFETVLKIGKPHVLINNAAISKFTVRFTEATVEQFDKVMNTNLRGAFMCAQAFTNANKGATYGRIINIASTRWNQSQPGWDIYTASKGGLVSLTTSLCISLANTPITANCISPGWIQVDDYDELLEEDHKFHPSGRVGKPSDIANACLFIAQEDNVFINGANLVIDGGVTKKMIYNHAFDDLE